MARAKISDTTSSIVNDSGAAMFSIVNGEQLHIQFAISWIEDLTGYNVFANVVEGQNDGTGAKPSGLKSFGVKRLLSKANGLIRGVDDGDNKFTIVIPWDLAAGFSPQPKPDKSVFAYIDIEIGEPGTGSADSPVGNPAAPDLQVWKPVKGLVEIMFSPTETIDDRG